MMKAASDDLVDYVRATALLLDMPLDAAQLQRVAAHLARTKLLADALAAVPLAPGDEPAEMFCPAPFPPQDSTP
jgi:hypothetical protein